MQFHTWNYMSNTIAFSFMHRTMTSIISMRFHARNYMVSYIETYGAMWCSVCFVWNHMNLIQQL